MKLKIFILLAAIAATAFKQEKGTIDLKWKVGKNETLNYATVMSDIDTSSFSMNFGHLFQSLSDSTDASLKKSQDFLNKFNEIFKNYDYNTTLTAQQKGIVDIVMTSHPKENNDVAETDSITRKQAEILKMMRAMNGNVVLRGSVYESGAIHSFWLKSSQKNLIALLFQLPTTPVQVGDKWSLDVSLIANDQNFVCDSSYQINEVTLSDIKEVQGERVAVLKYNVLEFVDGDFNSPMLFKDKGGKQKLTMKLSHQGIAEFSVDRGRWLSYDGIMTYDIDGAMSTHKKTKFTLIQE